ncbi:MAG: sigma-70 family RNA polymerase sigma factor [Phycisphaerales bacterium]|nr:MAG: sigma-70 family RNA polymerase sigma factor [Phycisphaerales bacterium]
MLRWPIVDSMSRNTLLKTTTSTDLLDRLKDPADQPAWDLFVNRYRPLIVNYAQHGFGLSAEDAEDAAQVTMADFARAFQAGQYERTKGRLRKWLFGIATKRIRNLARRKARIREIQLDDPSSETGFIQRVPDADVLKQAWETEWRQAVAQQCLEEIRFQFDTKTVIAFELYVWKDRPAREVADQLAMSENAVYLAKHHILKRIRELLPRMEEIW